MAVIAPATGSTHTATAAQPKHRSLRYMPGLDGVRAIAVMSVLLYHAGVPGLPGGFLGVDIFFVLSGFLITSLLLEELARSDQVDFGQFYLRRARRLLPALFLTLFFSAILVLLFARDAASQFRSDAVASLFYISNWAFIFQDLSYFEASGRPALLQHLWSLAVEEQFYLLWPLALLFLFRWGGRRGVGRVALITALVSTLLMALLSLVWNMPDATDASRLYFGTDTHAMGLLLGASMATVWRPTHLATKISRSAQMFIAAVGFGSLVVLLLILHNVTESSPWLYRGGFLVVSAVTALLIAAASHPAVDFGRLLATQPMKYIGERSYGLYLYHWPIMVVTRPGLDLPFEGWPAVIVQLGLTFAVAEASYRYVEIPVRRGVIGATWNKWRAQGPSGASARSAGVAAATAAVVTVTAVAVSAIPAPNASDYLGGVTSTGNEQLTPAPANARQALEQPEPAVDVDPAADYSKESITAIGDSVMLGAATTLGKALDVTVDASVSRQFPEIAARVQERAAAGQLDDVVVIHPGTNGTVYWDMLMTTMETLQDRKAVVLVTVNTPNSWMEDSNRNIRGVATKWKNVRLADWAALSDGHREYFVYDGTHLTGDGMKAYTQLIEDTLAGSN